VWVFIVSASIPLLSQACKFLLFVSLTACLCSLAFRWSLHRFLLCAETAQREVPAPRILRIQGTGICACRRRITSAHSSGPVPLR
jgi:hypothetical protein